MDQTQQYKQLQNELKKTQKELADLKREFYKNNFSNMYIFETPVTFKKNLVFPTADTTAAGAYKGRIPVLVNGVVQYIHYYDA